MAGKAKKKPAEEGVPKKIDVRSALFSMLEDVHESKKELEKAVDARIAAATDKARLEEAERAQSNRGAREKTRGLPLGVFSTCFVTWTARARNLSAHTRI